MKRLCVAALLCTSNSLLMGRRGKDPNRGLYVLPGGGVEDNESLEEALRRELKEETGLEIEDSPNRWQRPLVLELPDRVILVAYATVLGNEEPKDGSDLYDVKWFPFLELPPESEISSVVMPVLKGWGYEFSPA